MTIKKSQETSNLEMSLTNDIVQQMSSIYGSWSDVCGLLVIRFATPPLAVHSASWWLCSSFHWSLQIPVKNVPSLPIITSLYSLFSESPTTTMFLCHIPETELKVVLEGKLMESSPCINNIAQYWPKNSMTLNVNYTANLVIKLG